MCHLVNKSQPTSDIRCRFRGRVTNNGFIVFREGLDAWFLDSEPSEVYLFLTELKFFTVNNQSIFTHQFKKTNHPPPVFFKIMIACQTIINAALMAGKVRQNLIKPSIEGIVALPKTLWRPITPIRTNMSEKSSDMPIFFSEVGWDLLTKWHIMPNSVIC